MAYIKADDRYIPSSNVSAIRFNLNRAEMHLADQPGILPVYGGREELMKAVSEAGFIQSGSDWFNPDAVRFILVTNVMTIFLQGEQWVIRDPEAVQKFKAYISNKETPKTSKSRKTK
jgi:hypothetical protein